MTYDELFERLGAEGLTRGPTPPIAAPAPNAPWYTRAMLGFAGWIAGMFLVGFFVGGFMLLGESPPALMALGLTLLAVAVTIDRKAKEGDVVPQFALAIAFAGRAFFAWAVSEVVGGSDYHLVAWAVLAMEIVLFILLKSGLHRTLAVMIGAGAFYVAMHKLRLAGLGAGVIGMTLAVLWAREARWGPDARLHDPMGALGWGLAIAVVAWPVPTFFVSEARHATRLLETVGYGLGLAVLAWLLVLHAPWRRRVMALAAVVALCIAAYRCPGVIAGALVLLAGFASGRHTLAALGVAGIVGYLSAFYYQLDQTLLAKSASLAAAGLVLLGGRLLMRLEAKGGAR